MIGQWLVSGTPAFVFGRLPRPLTSGVLHQVDNGPEAATDAVEGDTLPPGPARTELEVQPAPYYGAVQVAVLSCRPPGA